MMTSQSLFGAVPAPMTLSQYTIAIGDAVRRSPVLQGAWVIAELSDVRVSGGHCYMELIEKNQVGQTVAKLRATIWQSRFQYIRQKFYASTGRDIMTGLKVMLNGTANHHQLYGLSFTVNDIDPSYTLGDMERLRREILMKLHNEGVLGLNKLKTMPAAPQRIAVISAAGAAGYGDFINHLMANQEGFVFYPFLVPAIMQGERTSLSVREALKFVQQTIDLWDCVAILRGGGATTDLNGFDDYELARDVAVFPLPVVVGIGHERDRTVLDEIAHTRLKTPTAVAAFFVDSLRSAYEKTGELVDTITRYVNDRISGEMRRLSNCETLIPALAETRIASAGALLEREISRIPAIVSAKLAQANGKIEMYRQLLKTLAPKTCVRSADRLDELSERLSLAADSALKRHAAKLESLEGMVGILSPENTLKRGYSITRVNGKAVTDAASLSSGTRISTRLHKGTIESEII